MAAPVNGPFELKPIRGSDRYGVAGRFVQQPLGVEVRGSDGLGPHTAAGRPVRVRVRWEVYELPPGASPRLLEGRFRTRTSSTASGGRVLLDMALGDVRGVYRVRATLPEHPDCRDAFFDAYTDGVVAQLVLEPITPVSVTRSMRVVARALDWRSRPVTGATLTFCLAPTFGPEPAEPAVPATELRAGRHAARLRSLRAGPRRLVVGDALTSYSQEFQVRFLPGPVRSIVLERAMLPPSRTLADGALAVARAVDRFGNLIPDVEMSWSASRGAARPAQPVPDATAAAFIRLREGAAVVTAEAGGRSASIGITGASVALVRGDTPAFTDTGEQFRMWLMVTNPPGGGTLEGISVRILEPVGVARRAGIEMPTDQLGLDPPEVVESDDGTVELFFGGAELQLDELGEDLLICELVYDCLAPEAACFEILDATITVAQSPGETYELNPGINECASQKAKTPRKLCLRFCIVAEATAGKTADQVYAALLLQARRYVTTAQAVFDINIPVCCPKITISACYERFDVVKYKQIIRAGAKANALEAPAPPRSTNPNEDTLTMPPDQVALLKECRTTGCIPVFIVPKLLFNPGGGAWFDILGEAVSRRDFPRTVQATGGPAIILKGGQPASSRALIHELGHLLIDLPRGVRFGSEHASPFQTKRVMVPLAPAGTEFTQEECSRILDSVSDFDGTCNHP